MNAVLDPSTKPAALPLSAHCNACDLDYEGQGNRHAPDVCPARPTVIRRTDQTATAIRAMLLERASSHADALADYWIAAICSDEETEARARSTRAFGDANMLRGTFAYYVSTGKSPVAYLRNYPIDDEHKAANEALAGELEARLSPPPPGWAEPDHEQD